MIINLNTFEGIANYVQVACQMMMMMMMMMIFLGTQHLLHQHYIYINIFVRVPNNVTKKQSCFICDTYKNTSEQLHINLHVIYS